MLVLRAICDPHSRFEDGFIPAAASGKPRPGRPAMDDAAQYVWKKKAAMLGPRAARGEPPGGQEGGPARAGPGADSRPRRQAAPPSLSTGSRGRAARGSGGRAERPAMRQKRGEAGLCAEPQSTARSVLKSVLKRTGSRKAGKAAAPLVAASARKKHRVQFDESLNKFFDADYVILIKEEDDPEAECYEDDPEDEEGEVCTCSLGAAQRRGRGFDLNFPETCAFEPPLQFVDQVTLSPPEGYKDSVGRQPRVDAATETPGGDISLEVAEDEESEHLEDHDSSTPAETAQRCGSEAAGSVAARERPLTPEDCRRPEEAEDIHLPQPRAGAENGKFQQQRYIVETITMTTVTERRIVREADDKHRRDAKSRNCSAECDSSRLNGILKGGKLWKSTDNSHAVDETSTSFSAIKESESSISTTGRRSVHFSEQATGQDVAVGHQMSGNEEASSPDSTELTLTFRLGNHVMVSNNTRPNSAVRQLFPSSQRLLSPPPLPHRDDEDDDDTMQQEGNPSKHPSDGVFTVTAESLRAFEESKRSKTTASTQQAVVQTSAAGGSDNESPKTQIRRTIERNALRRSLLRYSNNPSKNKKVTIPVKKNPENSLVERIRKLTCDIDEEDTDTKSDKTESNKAGVDVATETLAPIAVIEQIPPQSSPTGEEVKKSLERAAKFIASPNSEHCARLVDKTASPSASTSSSNSSGSSSSTYKKLTDLFARRNNAIPDSPTVSVQNDADISQVSPPLSTAESHHWGTSSCHHSECTQFKPPDLGNGANSIVNANPAKDFAGAVSPGSVPDCEKNFVGPKCAVSRMSVTAEARKQFLSTLAPLTACVSAPHGVLDEERYQQVAAAVPSDRTSVTSSSTGEETNYTLDDIDEALKEEQKAPQPDLVVGTQTDINGGGAVDELALFVQQDAGRIERIKKRYGLNSSGGTPTASDDDEHDDYGFNRRPSVRGIKPRFCSTSEILKQMQSQLYPPGLACSARVTWPHCQPVTTDDSSATYPSRRRSTMPSRCGATMPVLQEENPYGSPIDVKQQSPQQQPELERSRRYITPSQIMYASTGNLYQHPQQIMRIGGGCSDMYLPHPAASNSPPPRPYPQLQDPHFLVDDERFSSVQSLDRSCGGSFSRRTGPFQQGLTDMRVSPVYTAPFPDSAIVEPHYSTLQYAKTGPTSVIRLGQGQQQTIRVPYPSGTPVQVHLLARTGVGAPRSDSPPVGHQAPTSQFCGQYPYPFPAQPAHYAVARGTQTPVPPNARYCTPQQPITRTSSPLPSSPTRSKFSERGVPEGAASSSPSFPQDSAYPSTPASTSVYYAMNV
ncbi:uncharacterized protein LOC134538575 [Bacillus rossius redtenbacheri]|uniref:uncharacterized protein LOC134538575 n=1 Tax=Bacillus rossius redtenbacheri TaxID=93214 RepID=UPI002FDE4F99